MRDCLALRAREQGGTVWDGWKAFGTVLGRLAARAQVADWQLVSTIWDGGTACFGYMRKGSVRRWTQMGEQRGGEEAIYGYYGYLYLCLMKSNHSGKSLSEGATRER